MASTVLTLTSFPGVHMTCCVTKVMPIQFIDSNILKSCITGSTNHTKPISHHIMPLVINALRADTQTHRQTHTDRQTDTHIAMYKQKQFQAPVVCGHVHLV